MRALFRYFRIQSLKTVWDFTSTAHLCSHQLHVEGSLAPWARGQHRRGVAQGRREVTPPP